MHGSFDLRKIEYVEQCMCKRRSRQDMFDCVRMWEKEVHGRVKREQTLLEKEQRKKVYVKALEMRKKEINDLKEIEEKERKLQVTGQYTIRQPLYPILNKPHNDFLLLDRPPPPYDVPSAPHELAEVSGTELQKIRGSRSMLPADRASELRSTACKAIDSVVSASELLDNMKGWTEKEQLYFTETFGTKVIELFQKYSDELEPDDVATDHKQMRDGLFVFSQVADAIRRLVKLCVAAVRLQEEKRAGDVVALTTQTGVVQASIFGTDKTMIVHAKPMREAAPLYVPPKGSDMWRTLRKVDDRVVFGVSWKELEQMDGDREPAEKTYQLILDLPAAI
ncbi:hypothetical protein NDU88_008232 [Pleurodeles waltl]|uniref:Uncharacterized protein n=1 Tax=Pleurodeles waltl TaxID=8319 RepID=A0AAV7PP57_PLEWA|nr:hypothetical protein NDU88_008232 [Pleurodeles waltl]